MILYDDTRRSNRAIKSEKLNMFTVGGSYATLSGCKALISGCILGVDAFFFALQHSYGFLQSTYKKIT